MFRTDSVNELVNWVSALFLLLSREASLITSANIGRMFIKDAEVERF